MTALSAQIKPNNPIKRVPTLNPSEVISLYQMLGKGEVRIDPVSFGARYRNIQRTASCIPIQHENAAVLTAEKIADCYETKYDQVKAFYGSQGENAFALVRSDDGSPVSVSFPATAAMCDVARLLDLPEYVPFVVLGLHGLLVDKNHAWIFSHLCEVVYAVDSVNNLRDQIGEDLVDLIDDVRSGLAEAIYQYLNHVALVSPSLLRE